MDTATGERLYDVRLDRWETPASHYPRSRHGRAEVVTYRWKAGGAYLGHAARCPDGRRAVLFMAARPLKITSLEINGRTWMVDDPVHWYTILEHAEAYHGYVLCAGLGLGLIVHALARNPAVSRVTVVECDPDVIALVKPHVPPCEVVTADWDNYLPSAGPVDGIFYDLFVGDARSMLGQAVDVVAGLRARYPGAVLRVLGFPIDLLERCAAAVGAASAGADAPPGVAR